MDYTLCEDKSCPLNKKCFRFMVKTNSLHQSYFIGSPYNGVKNSCEYFWKIEKINYEKSI